jgi:CRISPR-associated protein Cas2
MMYVVIYDISDDNLRAKVAAFLKSKGLVRLQYSAFAGQLTSSQLRDVEGGIRILFRKMEGERKSLIIFPLTEPQYEKRIAIGETLKDEEDNVIM